MGWENELLWLRSPVSDSHDCGNVAVLLKLLNVQITMTSFRYIFIPVCTGVKVHQTRTTTGSHWLLLVADVAERHVYVLNSIENLHTAEYYTNLFT